MQKTNQHNFSQEKAIIKKTLEGFDEITLALVFGSVATQKAGFDSDLDIAILTTIKLSDALKLQVINALAESTGRPVDLVDLREVGEPLLGQIVQNGAMLIGNNTQKANLLTKHLLDEADFMPYKTRILAERRNQWISK